MVVGDMGAGKTSLLRALGREIPPGERIATREFDQELYLDDVELRVNAGQEERPEQRVDRAPADELVDAVLAWASRDARGRALS
ncbi:hypothetical protein ACFWUQ_24005 [Streptomyces sp. NPDC058662]|uniref:hypothetical protein n=1 Tax=Streptomyces sp. NPDC058662 TaxID=3346583 RepID=UPI003658FA12